MIVTLEDDESTGGDYWLVRLSLEDVESTGGGYWLMNDDSYSGGC